MTDESRARADYRAIKGMQEYASHQIEVAFEKGFAQCDKQLQEACDNARREGYGEGLNAAWDCARKIIPLWEKGNTADIFGTRDIETIFKRYFASDAISKIKEYEDECCICNSCKYAYPDCPGDERYFGRTLDFSDVITTCVFYIEKQKQTDDELRIGDEVIVGNDKNGYLEAKFIVTGFNKEGSVYLLNRGNGGSTIAIRKGCHKTGKHFQQISQVLEKGDE